MNTISPSKLYPKSVNFNNCDKEPIHIIGKIQSHGVLIACNIVDKVITRSSSNCDTLFNQGDVLGKNLNTLLDEIVINSFSNELKKAKIFFKEIILNNTTVTLIVHKSDTEYVLEFEVNPIALNAYEYQNKLTYTITSLNNLYGIEEMCNMAALCIKEYLEYDRVMVYQFDSDWNGTVVAEEREAHLESWLGLKYPATDIPQQARKLFLKQGVRILCDVNAEPLSILSRSSNFKPLDLSNSELRAVSPIHIEYLTNMKVCATLTAAIVVDGVLWGLIACHHYSPKYLNYYQRLNCKFLTQVFANRIQLDNSNYLLEKLKDSTLIRDKFIGQITKTASIAQGLCSFPTTLIHLNNASGGAVCIDNEIVTIGNCPSEEVIKDILENKANKAEEGIYFTDNYSRTINQPYDFNANASGVLCVYLSRSNQDALLWFKPEVIEIIDWAGKPNKTFTKDDNQKLSPRKSFQKWSVAQSGKSQPWEDYEISSAISLQKDVQEIIINKYDEVKQLNHNLKKAYEDLESFSYVVSHDLRAPLRGIDGFAEIIKEDYYEVLDDFGKSSLESIITSAIKMNKLIDDILIYSGLGKKSMKFENFSMQDTIAEAYDGLKSKYPNTIFKVDATIPEAFGDQSIIKLLIRNIIENAFKYSSKVKDPVVQVGALNSTTFFVKDNGIGMDLETHKRYIYGVFNRLVDDEEYSGSGIGLAIVKKVVEKHNGKVWIESTPGNGSVFYFNFNSK